MLYCTWQFKLLLVQVALSQSVSFPQHTHTPNPLLCSCPSIFHIYFFFFKLLLSQLLSLSLLPSYRLQDLLQLSYAKLKASCKRGSIIWPQSSWMHINWDLFKMRTSRVTSPQVNDASYLKIYMWDMWEDILKAQVQCKFQNCTCWCWLLCTFSFLLTNSSSRVKN